MLTKHPDGPHMVIEKKEFDIPCKYFSLGRCQKNLNGFCDWKNAKYDCKYGPHYIKHTYAEKQAYLAKKKKRDKLKENQATTQIQNAFPKVKVGTLVETTKYGIRKVYQLHKKSFDIIIPELNNRLIRIRKKNPDYRIIDYVGKNQPSPDLLHPGISVMIAGKGKSKIIAVDGCTVYYETYATGVRGSVLRHMVSPIKKETSNPSQNKVEPILSTNLVLPEAIVNSMSRECIEYKISKEVRLNSGDVLIFGKEGYTISQVKDTEVFFTRKSSIKMKQYLFGFIERISFTSYYICKLKEETKSEK